MIEWDENIVKAKRTYTAEDYGLEQEVYDELVEQLHLEPWTAEFNAELSSRWWKLPTQWKWNWEVIGTKRLTAEDYGLKQPVYDELVEQLYLEPWTAEFNAEAVSRWWKIPAQLKWKWGVIEWTEVTNKPWVPVVEEKPWVKPVAPEIKPPLIPDVSPRVSAAVIAILANKDKNETINIEVPWSIWFEWSPQDQQEVTELQELLSKSPTREEIKNLIRSNKDAFRKLVLVKDWVNGWANVNFDILNYLVEQWKFNGLDWNIQEQLKHDIIRYIGLWDLLEDWTTFTVTSVDWTKRNGTIVNNRAVDEKGKYIPIFQWDHVESDALWFLNPIYTNNSTEESQK